MQNKVDFQIPPEDLFLNPAQDPDIAALGPVEWFWRERAPARIVAVNASEYPEIAERIDKMILRNTRHKRFTQAVEFNTVPVELTHASFKKSYVTASGRCLLSGASGMRLLNRWYLMNLGTPAGEDLTAYFTRSQSQGAERHFPRQTTPAADTPFAIECRNTFNFYHFVTESLGQLSLLDDLPGDRPIFMHFPNREERTRRFTRDFIKALYPEYADRITFERAPKHYERVIVPYNLMNSYYHYPEELVESLDGYIKHGSLWEGRRATRVSHSMLEMNAVDTNLVRLRERGLRAIAGMDFSHLPRRFYVQRTASQSRVRKMRGEAELLEALKPFGFEEIAFETLSPLDQIGLMANAEMMISPHGAGFANMLFANSSAQVMEIGTLQTGIYRWGDFWRLASVSGCTYITFFADYDKHDPTVDPRYSTDGIVPVNLTPSGREAVMSFLSTSLGRIAHYEKREDILRLARQMNQIGAHERVLELLAHHPGAEAGDADLHREIAEAQRGLGNGYEELAALENARDADPTRPDLASQVAWCAQKLRDREALGRALAVLEESYPEQYEKMAKMGRRWMRELA